MSDFKDALFMAGGREFDFDNTDRKSTVHVIKKDDEEGNVTFEFNVKFTVSANSAINAMQSIEQLVEQDETSILNLTNVVIMQDVLNKAEANYKVPDSGKLKFSAIPITKVGDDETPLNMTIELGFKDGGKTSNKKTSQSVTG